MKYVPERAAIFPVVKNITTRNATTMSVSQSDMLSMEAKTETMVTSDESTCGSVWDIIWRSASVSLV